MNRSIEDQLVGIGNMIEIARRKSVSLSSAERRIIDRVHTQAIQAGFGWNGINALEMEGERGRRGSMCFPISARFIGLQEAWIFGLKIRLYNIEGDHPRNHSTVGVTELVRERIPVLDLSIPGVWREVLKEQLLISSWTVISGWERVAALFGKKS